MLLSLPPIPLISILCLYVLVLYTKLDFFLSHFFLILSIILYDTLFNASVNSSNLIFSCLSTINIITSQSSLNFQINSKKIFLSLTYTYVFIQCISQYFICGEYINGGFSGYTRKIAVAVQVLAKIPAALQTGSDQKNIFLCAAIWVFDQIF